MIIDGKLVSTKLKEKLKNQIKEYNINPKLVVIQVGNNEASNVYIRQKIKCADAIGAKCEHKKLEETICCNIHRAGFFNLGFCRSAVRCYLVADHPD